MPQLDPMHAIAALAASALADGRSIDFAAEATAIHRDHPDCGMTLEDIIDALFFEHMRCLLWS